jgi:heterodisulfide reductase subunit A
MKPNTGKGAKVLIIGGGIAGLSAATALCDLGISPLVLEKSPFLGGHAIQFACKATDSCQNCFACSVEEQLRKVTENPQILGTLNSELKRLTKKDGRFMAVIERYPALIDPERCNNCGECFKVCPEADKAAIQEAYSVYNQSRYGINIDRCLYFAKDKSCNRCQEACPENAIALDQDAEKMEREFDAVIVASGFTPADPAEKDQFGYGTHKNVVSALELERILRSRGKAIRPSDEKEPKKIAFIQCVGSRERKRPFCSRACAYALRMAAAIRARQPDIETTTFYIDIQSFGKEFLKTYKALKADIRMVRMIPGDVYQVEGDRLCVSFMDHATHQALDEVFDMAVLSVGLMPGKDNKVLSELLRIDLDETGFFSPPDHTAGRETTQDGIFVAGTARGPMDIADTIADAGKAAWEAARYLITDTTSWRYP